MPLDSQTQLWVDSRYTFSDITKIGEIQTQKKKMAPEEIYELSF